jgi:hypothetical protein
MDTLTPISTVADPAACNRRLSAQEVSELSDSALQERIRECGEKMLAADMLYGSSSDLAYAGERDFWWMQERLALIERGRRPGVVAGMEAARGLDGR